MFEIRPDDLSGHPTQALLALHLRGMQAHSPVESVHALDLSGLKRPDVCVFSAWDGAEVVGIAALRALPATCGEVKSMRTHPAHLRRGVAAQLLEYLIGEARRRGWSVLSLETGSGQAFDPALALYRRRGFVEGEAFSDYVRTDFNRFFHLDLR